MPPHPIESHEVWKTFRLPQDRPFTLKQRVLHPGRSRLMTKPVTVAWGLTPYSEGVGALWADPGETLGGVGRGALYAELLKPEGPIVFAGEHLSYQPTWQEGAALSAHDALNLVAAMAKEKAVHA